MAIDTEAKRRNVSRMLLKALFMGLSPSSGMDTDDRVNTAGAYIGFDYTVVASNPENIDLYTPITTGLNMATRITKGLTLSTVVE